jgi:hypothetical protein
MGSLSLRFVDSAPINDGVLRENHVAGAPIVGNRDYRTRSHVTPISILVVHVRVKVKSCRF